MIEVKILEVRDRATCIPVIAIRLGSEFSRERALCARAGFGREIETQQDYILVGILAEQGKFYYDPFAWPGGARTLPHAHRHIQEHWESLNPGAVVDVQFILGETDAPAPSDVVS